MSKKKPKEPRPRTDSKRKPSSRAATRTTASRSKWTRTERPFPLPPHVREAIARLDDEGHVAYVVGGCVRDFLMSPEAGGKARPIPFRPIKDYDIATSALPDEITRIFPRSVTVGKAFGVLKVPFGEEGELVEIATFREDLEYADFRHPKKVRFASAEEDARRRDFTINALYFDPKTSRILDPTGGLEDLRAGILRAIGDPVERFREDALRLLRAARFATRFDFALEPDTLEAIRARARLVTKVSAERIRDELTLMWTGPRPAAALQLLARLGLLAPVLPELEALRAQEEVWSHALRVVEQLAQQAPGRSAALAWAAVLLDVGKPVAARKAGAGGAGAGAARRGGSAGGGGQNYSGHEIDGARIAAAVAERLRMSRAEIDRISAIVSDHLKFRDVFQMREATLERFVREPHFEELLTLHRADASATDGNLAFFEFCASRLAAAREAEAAPRLVDGTDLIQLGLKPGPEFSAILRAIEDLALERKLGTKEEALEYVVRHFVK